MESKYSNSEIGSHHWAATLLSFIMRVGEYLETHDNTALGVKHYSEWGRQMKERAIEINNYLQSMPEMESKVTPDKPDFEKMADFQWTASGGTPFYRVANAVGEKIWSDYVQPLQSKVRELEASREIFAIKFAKWKNEKSWEYDYREQYTHTDEELMKYFKKELEGEIERLKNQPPSQDTFGK